KKYLKRRGKKFHFLYNWVIKNLVIITFNIFIHNKYKNTDLYYQVNTRSNYTNKSSTRRIYTRNLLCIDLQVGKNNVNSII
ncbi:hypothetical protein BpHYR1_000290, partial [Brachionus plicatilis]